MKGKGKEKSINKEEIAENWCFVCKDGGDLRICDYKQCLKSYHHFCVGKDESFLESEKKWNCAWHSCSDCHKSSYLHCYTCKNATCRRCLSTADILQVKGQYGFCRICLKLALLIEENRDYDSDGGKVDFTDRETIEGLYMEYYVIIKKEEGFELADIYAAIERVKTKKSHEAKSGSEDFDEEEEPISDYDDLELQKKKRTKRQNKSNGQKSAKRTPAKSNKNEFIGWASRALAEFLGSIGKNTEEKLSQRDVTTIVNEYVKEKKLLNPEKKRFVMCDTQLHTLFRKKMINKSRIHELLEVHFAENHEESEPEEDDNVGSDSEDDNLSTLNPCKRQRKMCAEKKSGGNDDVENIVPLKSRFASIVVENLKLVCIGRGVLKEMLKEAKTFEEKVTGCFVRVKSDPYDCRPTSHQLVQVKGVKTILIDETNMENVLLLSAMPNEIRIPLVSDENVSEEECEDLRKRVMAGEIERPTVEFFQHKVNVVHKDMTNHSIRKELNLLQHLIELANEKGWRREMFGHLERRKKLQSPMEQSRLLKNVPTVIAEVYEPGCDSEDGKVDIKSDEGSSAFNSPVPHDGQQDDKASDVYETDCDSKDEKSDEGSTETKPPCSSPVPSDGQQDHKSSEDENSLDVQTSPSKKDQTVSKKSGHNEPQEAPILDSEPEQAKAKECEGSKKIEVIDIPSDEDDDGNKDGLRDCAINDDGPENETWCMKSPEGAVLKSLTLSVLRRWSEKSRYWSEFSVWREGEREEDGIPLPEALSKK